MKTPYLLASALALCSLTLKGQIYSTHFDNSVQDAFLQETNFFANQNGSNLIIKSQGHDENAKVTYTLNDGSDATMFSMTSGDTVYVRARAEYTGDVKPILNIDLVDDQGIGPNNNEYNAVNFLTLESEWKILKFVVPNWNMTFGDSNDPNLGMTTDSTKISQLRFGPNTSFASFPKTNADGDLVNFSFVGTIYIDYVSVGEPLVNGTELDVFTSYDHAFTQESLSSLNSAPAFSNSISNNSLVISSQGHDEFDLINVPVKDGVVDITNDVRLSFEVSSSVSSTTESPIGFMVTAVDEAGIRIEYPGLFTVQSLSPEKKVVVVDFNDDFRRVTEITVNANPKRIASFDILINQAFASPFRSTNDLGQVVDKPFVGDITLSKLVLDTKILSVENELEKREVSFFPNPAKSIITLENELNKASYTVSTLSGKVVLEGNLNGNQIDVSSLEAGSFVLTVKEEDKVFTTLIAKE